MNIRRIANIFGEDWNIRGTEFWKPYLRLIIIPSVLLPIGLGITKGSSWTCIPVMLAFGVLMWFGARYAPYVARKLDAVDKWMKKEAGE